MERHEKSSEHTKLIHIFITYSFWAAVYADWHLTFLASQKKSSSEPFSLLSSSRPSVALAVSDYGIVSNQTHNRISIKHPLTQHNRQTQDKTADHTVHSKTKERERSEKE
jgi:hypothetical protein